MGRVTLTSPDRPTIRFPATPGAFQAMFGGPFSAQPGIIASPFDAYLVKLNASGSAMIWSTFLGGTGNDVAHSIAVDTAGNVWANGTTTSTNFPAGEGLGGDFLVEASESGSALIYNARYPNGTAAQSVAVDPTGLVHFAGVNGVVSEITPGATILSAVFGIQNGFGGAASGQVASAEVISIFGRLLGPVKAVPAAPINGFYPTTLGGVQVSISGTNMPLLYVSESQINAVVPMGLPNGAATIHIVNGTSSVAFPVQVVNSAPQAFGGVLNQDSTLNSENNPARPGSIVTFYATGFQPTFYPLTDGQVATVAQNYCGSLCLVNPSSATILYGGAAPGIVAGVTQFNVKLPALSDPTLLDLYPFGSLFYPPVSVWIAP